MIGTQTGIRLQIEGKKIDLHDKALLPRSLEIGFHPFIRGLSASAATCSPNLVADINHLERIQSLATRLVTGIRHLPRI